MRENGLPRNWMFLLRLLMKKPKFWRVCEAYGMSIVATAQPNVQAIANGSLFVYAAA
jgi:hypothetical protein